MSGYYPASDETSLRKIVLAVQQLYDGRNNATGSLTLTAGATTTTVTAANCGAESAIVLSPKTANAAAAVGTTYISSVTSGSFVVTHANAATTDRSFFYAISG